MDTPLPTLAQRIRAARERCNLTREELSEFVGISAKSIQRYEEAKQTPRLQTLEKIGAVLDLSVEAFLLPPALATASPRNSPASITELARGQQQIMERLDSLSIMLAQLMHLIERKLP